MEEGRDTWVRILQFLLEPGEGWAQCVWELEEDLVQGEDGLLADVGAGVVEEAHNVG